MWSGLYDSIHVSNHLACQNPTSRQFTHPMHSCDLHGHRTNVSPKLYVPKEHVGTYDSRNYLNGVPQPVSIECEIVDPKTFGFYVKNAIKCDIGQGHYIMTTLTWIPLYKIKQTYILYIYIYILYVIHTRNALWQLSLPANSLSMWTQYSRRLLAEASMESSGEWM